MSAWRPAPAVQDKRWPLERYLDLARHHGDQGLDAGLLLRPG